MNVQDRPDTFDMGKYGVGQPVPRTEDPVLVQGQGHYTDDLNLPKQAYAAFVRSRHAHGVIKAIDTSAANGMPGVLAIYTGADLSAYGTMKCAVPFKNRDGRTLTSLIGVALETTVPEERIGQNARLIAVMLDGRDAGHTTIDFAGLD